MDLLARRHPRQSAWTVWTAALLIALACSAAFSSGPSEPTVRVGLLRFFSAVKQVATSAPSGHIVTDCATGGVVVSVADGSPTVLRASGAGLLIERLGSDPIPVSSAVVVTATDPCAIVKVESPTRPTRGYRGAVEISAKRGALTLVNTVGLEDYVRGVVPEEMPASYPTEALKAQAVAARTYALANVGKHKSDGYDLCDTNMCQHYGGASAEKAKCSEAVAETRGAVLVFQGRPANVMYSTDCGGATQDYSESHPGKAIPYLRCVVEPEGIIHRTWELKLSLKQLQERLLAAGVTQADGLKAIRVTVTSPSGRPQELEITGTSGTAKVPGYRLRAVLGQHTIKSTMFTVETLPDGSVLFRGKGAGHGHGMCQVGSKALALPPFRYSFDRILAHYFPGTELSPCAAVPSDLAQQVTSTEPTQVAEQKKQNVGPSPKETESAPPEKPKEIKLRVRLKAPGRL